MCNAWNHASYCHCGFGGENHGGAGILDGPGVFADYDSYVNPFATCPVCGAGVFFFQADNGGRVYFDELGPPWPKHPCTDRRLDRDVIPIDRTPRSPRVPGTTAWEKAGWSPFLLRGASLPRGQRQYRIEGRLLNTHAPPYVSILMDEKLVAQVSDWVNRWDLTAPTFYRRTGTPCELAGITLRGGPIKEHLLRGQAWC